MGINPYNYNTLMAKVRAATVKLTEEVKAVATRALGRAEEAYEHAEDAGQIANIANRLAEDIIYTHLQYDENATYSKMVYGINILGQEPDNWLQDKRYNTITGELEDYDNRICTDELISVTPETKYIFSTYDCKGYIKQLRVSIVCYDADGEYVGYLSDKAGIFTVTIPSNTAKIGVTIFTNEPASSFTILTSVIGISIFPWSVTPLEEEDTNATYIGMYSSNEQEIPDDTDPASYIWRLIKNTEEGFTPIIPGTSEGEQGPPGPPGSTGVSITRTVFEYAVNNSTTTAPTSGWSESQPDVTTENPVLWQRIKTTYSDSTVQYTGTIPSVVFQRIVTFINAAQSGQQGTVINGGAIMTETIAADRITSNTISTAQIIADYLTGTNGAINLQQGIFNFNSANSSDYITWDGSKLQIRANEILFGESARNLSELNEKVESIKNYDSDLSALSTDLSNLQTIVTSNYSELNQAIINEQESKNRFLRWSDETGLQISNDFSGLRIIQIDGDKIAFFVNGQAVALITASAMNIPTVLSRYHYFKKDSTTPGYILEVKEDNSIEFKEE